ncbi:hypothetical protein [Paraglaciecola psychrophila]|jgi:hypothetical protein|uniref:Uncharacterized protein n=1 Tax=Paraglaciecola psychrophila 170 TaxID=1129794 RepID=K7ADU2_9ALTE|nr:hypothetical protein [Paraglaciecola psychrophila]AGH44207.1 hypothetical protein C427_2098 [Paraglaciecola psychrophila 170]GAC40397.1 hypothetical protein GPSY_4795 [Paraglaciecola psychrophila 170]
MCKETWLSGDRSLEPIILLGKSEFQTLICSHNKNTAFSACFYHKSIQLLGRMSALFLTSLSALVQNNKRRARGHHTQVT